MPRKSSKSTLRSKRPKSRKRSKSHLRRENPEEGIQTFSSIPSGGTPPFYIVSEEPEIEKGKPSEANKKLTQEFATTLIQNVAKMKDIIAERKKKPIFVDIEPE